VLHPRPAHRASYPLLCTIGPRFRLRPSPRSPRGDALALGYPSALPAWGRTCSLYAYRIFVTLDAVLKSGMLAERPDKRPGIPGTQHAHPSNGVPSMVDDVGREHRNRYRDRYRDRTPCEAITKTKHGQPPEETIPISIAIAIWRERRLSAWACRGTRERHEIGQPRPAPHNTEEKRETNPNTAPTEPPFAFGSGGRWALTLCRGRSIL